MKFWLQLNDLLYNDLNSQFTNRRTESLFKTIRKWQYLVYVLTPFLLFIKTHLIAFVLSVGTYFMNLKITHKELWNIVLKAELIFPLASVIKLIWFLFFVTDFTLEEVQVFYPFSLLNFIALETLEPWYMYPLQVINLFEVFYWVVLAALLDKALKINKKNLGMKVVAISYGPVLLIWIVMVMFFTLNIS